MKSKNHSYKLAFAAGAIAALVSTNAYAQQGMGVGNSNPQEMLDVSGAIKIGTTTNTNAGTIRWTGTEFQGWDGTQWITFGGGIATQLTEAQVEAFVTNGPIDLFSGTTLNGSPILTTEVDGSTTNEIQDLQLVGNILTITNNGTATQIDLSPYANAAVTLDAAYDQGGAGAGREIDAVDGTVAITGEDGIMVSGTYGSGLAVGAAGGIADGAGTRMFFNPKKAAIRAGYVNGTQWDDANIGAYSTAMGNITTASGFASTAMGNITTASGSYSTAMGYNATASGITSTAMGSSTTASGSRSIAMGYQTTASGSNSTAMGYNTEASGTSSTAMGSITTASGSRSTAMGSSTTASGFASIALGSGTNASGNNSTAMGRSTTAPSYAETAIGRYNTTYTPASATAWNATDRLFVVGNGTGNSALSNALTIYKSGKMNINDAYNMPTADGTAGQVMTTDGAGVVSFVDPNTLVTPTTTNTLDGAYDQGGAGAGREIDAVDGTVAITGEDGIMVSGTFGNGLAVGATDGIADGAGTRMFFNPSKAAFRAGYVDGAQWNAANIGDYSTATGHNTTASGDFSTATGYNTTASGNFSTATGYNTTASGTASTAMGGYTTASGSRSTAMGSSTNASGYRSTAMGSSTTASGDFSTAMGSGTTASGDFSTAMGYQTTASGDRSTATGSGTTASGFASIALGSGTTASGDESTAMGRSTTAPSYAETAVGRYNTTYTPSSTTAWNATDRLFVIGNGTGTGVNSSNALTIYKSGKMNINDAYDMPTADGTAGQVMTTDGAGVVSFVDPGTLNPVIFANTSGVTSNENGTYTTDDFVFGSPQLADNGNTANDNRFFFDKSKGAFRAGSVTGTQWDDANIGGYSTAMGYITTASGSRSTAMGSVTTASGSRSTAMGYQTTASGSVSTAMGYWTTASGNNSTAMGKLTTASGNVSTAMGRSTTAPSYAETAVGRYNTSYTPANTTAWNAADRLFVIGNGTGPGVNSSNAMVILKNGKTGFGTSTPTSNVHIKNTGDASIWIEADSDNVTESDNAYLKMTQDGNLVKSIIGLSGANNTSPTGDAYTDVLTNALLVGTETANADLQLGTNNAVRMTIAKTTGRVGIRTTAPTSDLHLKMSASDSPNPTTGGITLEQSNSTAEWQIWNSDPFLSFARNNVRVAYVNSNSGAWTVTSDRRVKKDIEPMENVLSKVMQLNTVKYRYNHNADDATKTRGFIAQEVQEVFPDLVYSEDGSQLGIAPSDFGILSIKAIQEQQAQIEAQQVVNEQQQALIEQLLQRIEQLENR